MSTHLLYFDPSAVGDDINLPGMMRFFQSPYSFIDRTGTVTPPIRMKLLFPMPTLRPMKKSFEEICDARAYELLARADSLGSTLYVLYSGGIDSTLVLISLLKSANKKQKENIVVLLSDDSIIENPLFYQESIHGKLRVESSGIFNQLLGSPNMLIGGEHNDQLFGSDKMGKLILKFGHSIINKPYSRDTFFELFNEHIEDNNVTNFYLDLFERMKDTAPVEIVTNQDYLWWLNFSLKWQTVFMRILPRISPRNISCIDSQYLGTRYDHFFSTEDFQLWSMNNMDKKIKDKWNTYKWVCKDIIYDYTKDADYRDNKIKRGSLYSVLMQQDSYNFIDESMKFSKELDLNKYYEPNNDFI